MGFCSHKLLIVCARFDGFLSQQLTSRFGCFVVIYWFLLWLNGSLLELLTFRELLHLRIRIVAFRNFRNFRLLFILFNCLVSNEYFLQLMPKQLRFHSLSRVVFYGLVHNFTQIVFSLFLQWLGEVKIDLILLSLFLLLLFCLLLPTVSHELAKLFFKLAYKWVICCIDVAEFHRCEVALIDEAVVALVGSCFLEFLLFGVSVEELLQILFISRCLILYLPFL